MPNKIALCLIVKPTEQEGKLLAEAISSVGTAVDGVFITQAGDAPNAYVSSVIQMFGGVESFYKWDDNFANARNFNFQQVPEDFDYILWLDADDVLVNAEMLRDTIADNPSVDCFSLWYHYAFDEWGNPIVVHHKTRIVRNDGCVEWAGALHEDFKQNRKLEIQHIEGIHVDHDTNPDRIEDSKRRNVTVAEHMAETDPEDPRTYWNLGNAHRAAGNFEESLRAFDAFFEMSKSDDEKYIARLRQAENLHALNRKDEAIDQLRYAIGLKPDYPDAYIQLGQMFYHAGNYSEAISLLKQSLKLEPPKYKIIVFNPMDYQYTPFKWLGYSYIAIDQPMLALHCFETLLQFTPKDEKLKEVVSSIKEKADKYEEMLTLYNEIKDLDKMQMAIELAKLPDEFKHAPMFINLRNKNFIKTESSGKEVVFMCSYTVREWTPDSVKEGIGGSEEAVINLADQLAEKGYEVTVYNNCGHKEQKFGKVRYKPFYAFNYRDVVDTLILWRHPKLTDYPLAAKRVFLDLHDVLPEAELSPKRLKKIDKIFVKSEFHRSLFPTVPQEKFVVAPNGIHWKELQKGTRRDAMLLVNTSSPDRSLSALIRLFKRVKELVPDAKCKWAYGWSVFDAVHKDNPEIMAWKDRMIREMEEVGIENLGRISHEAVAKLYRQARIFAYPTEFAEIDCISARKAQAAGALPITTDFAALDETVENGVKIHSPKTKDTWCLPGQFDFALDNELAEEKWVDAVVAELRTKQVEDHEMRESMKKFDWANIADIWESQLTSSGKG